MDSAGHAFQLLSYGAMILALLYFAHKVVWFLQFRKIQSRMVERALERLRERTETTLIRWDRGADTSWSEAIGGSATETPVDFITRREAALSTLIRGIRESRRTVKQPLDEAIVNERGLTTIPVLTIGRVRAAPVPVTIHAEFRTLRRPTPPDSDLFRLEVRSRYGLVRRLLVFLLGPADVVYSSAHMARMSQNTALPASVFLRRVSLLLVVVSAIACDIAFQIRPRLVELSERLIAHRLDVAHDTPLASFINENIHTFIGFSAWLAGYGAIYAGLFLYLFVRSRRHLRLLRLMEHESSTQMDALVAHHVHQLRGWIAEYAKTLDDASAITVVQIEMLVDRSIDRMRRRLASPELLTFAQALAHALFGKLPESSTALADVATQHEHSMAHAFWPRESEMRYQVHLAQYRAAWRYLESTTNELRGHRPEPRIASDLWRNLVAYARMFPDLVPPDFADMLEAARDRTFAALVTETDSDFHDLDGRLVELAEGLEHTVGSAPSLIASRLQLTDESLEADGARFAADVLRVREQARLEAMAFEI